LQKKSNQLPTIDAFLQFKPKRLDYEWTINEEDLVSITIPKFKSNLGKSFCKLVRKDNTFTANLDKLGSLVWKNCDGKQTVKHILDTVKKAFPHEENIDQRLFVFLQQMKNLDYLDF